MPAKPLLAAVFDYGGVLTVPIPFTTDDTGLSSEQLAIRNAIRRAVKGEDPQRPWARLERGEITMLHCADLLDEEFPGLGERFRGSVTMDRLAIRPEMVELVTALKAGGIETALCTNNTKEFRSSWEAKLDLPRMFDHVVDSSEVGMRKPEPRIYAHVASLLRCDISEAVFVDDFEENIDGARDAGFQTIHVGPDDAHIARLNELFPLLAR